MLIRLIAAPIVAPIFPLAPPFLGRNVGRRGVAGGNDQRRPWRRRIVGCALLGAGKFDGWLGFSVNPAWTWHYNQRVRNSSARTDSSRTLAGKLRYMLSTIANRRHGGRSGARRYHVQSPQGQRWEYDHRVTSPGPSTGLHARFELRCPILLSRDLSPNLRCGLVGS